MIADICPCSMDQMPKPGMPLPPHAMAHPRMPADHLSGVKHMPVVARGSPVYPQPQLSDMCYDARPPPSVSQYEPSQYSTGMGRGNCASALVTGVKLPSFYFVPRDVLGK